MIEDGLAGDGRALMVTILAALCGLCVAALLVAERNGAPKLTAASKTAASLAFVALALAAGAVDSPSGRWILAGLLLCAIGDVLLLWRAKSIFLAGMAAFAGGHAAYLAAFVHAGAEYRSGVLAAGLVMAWFGVSMVRWLWPHLGRFRAPVIGYTAIIGAMVVASVAASLGAGEARYAIGAIVFAASDVFVARDRFVKDAFANKAVGLPLYYGAQLLLASAA